MKSSILFLTVILVVVSCGLTEVVDGRESYDNHGNIWGGPMDNGSLQQICYITALDYQKGYDWRNDLSKGTVRCSLVVFADGNPVMKVPVGDAYETGSDPDMHRIIGGHLYTDYSTGSETVIKKDGEEIFRYSGLESLSGMAVDGEDIYTLGEDRYGRGFSYRKNGEVLVSRSDAKLIGPLRHSGKNPSFAFSEIVRSSDGQAERYYVVVGTDVSQVTLKDNVRNVWDIAYIGKTVVCLASVVGLAAPVLFQDDVITALSLPLETELVSSSMICEDSRYCVEMNYRSANGMMHTSVWMNGLLLNTFDRDWPIMSWSLLDNDICCAVNPMEDECPGTIYRSGDLYIMPEGYFCISENVVSIVNGIMYVGLSSAKGNKPVVWKDGRLDTLKINGYISSVCASDVSGED